MPLGVTLHLCDVFYRCMRAVTADTASKVPLPVFHTFLEPVYDLVAQSPNKASWIGLNTWGRQWRDLNSSTQSSLTKVSLSGRLVTRSLRLVTR